MNLCGGHPRTRQVFRSYSTSNLDTKDYRRSVPMRVSTTDLFEQEKACLKSETDVNSIVRNKESSHLSIERTTSAFQQQGRCQTIEEHESKPEQTLKHAKSFRTSKLTTQQQEQKKYSFKKLFDRKIPCFVLTHERSEHESASQASTKKSEQKKIKSKPLLRSLSSSCLSLAAKSRPKVINRLSCPDNLIPSDQNTRGSQANQDHRDKRYGTKPVDKTPTGANVTTRLKNSFKFRHSSEITKRDSRILVTRFELELAITKDIRHKLVSFINSKSINLNARDYYGKTLLHTACSVGNYQCAQILINAGAKVGIQDQAGFTPLHCAVVANHVPCAAVMIAAGADVMTSTRTMHTALTLAHEEEMILLVGRSLLLRGTQRKTVKDDNKCFSLRETKL